MGKGPIILFDKSSLESLNVDESTWLDHFYTANITPLFYVETLADLEKKVEDGRTSEQVVRQLVRKTPIDGMPNAHHERICTSNLMGEEVPLRSVPAVAEGQSVVSDGRKGIVYRDLPEWAAFERWQSGKYLEVEREFARSWRSALQQIDLEAVYDDFRPMVAGNRPRSLEEVRALAENELFATDKGDSPLANVLDSV